MVVYFARSFFTVSTHDTFLIPLGCFAGQFRYTSRACLAGASIGSLSRCPSHFIQFASVIQEDTSYQCIKQSHSDPHIQLFVCQDLTHAVERHSCQLVLSDYVVFCEKDCAKGIYISPINFFSVDYNIIIFCFAGE